MRGRALEGAGLGALGFIGALALSFATTMLAVVEIALAIKLVEWLTGWNLARWVLQ